MGTRKKPTKKNTRKNTKKKNTQKKKYGAEKNRRSRGRKTPYKKKRAATPAKKSAGTAIVNITNLDRAVTEADVREIFSKIGKVKKAVVMYNAKGQSRGAALVTFANGASAAKAVREYHQAEVDGRPMYVKAVSYNARPATPQKKKATTKKAKKVPRKRVPRKRVAKVKERASKVPRKRVVRKARKNSKNRNPKQSKN